MKSTSTILKQSAKQLRLSPVAHSRAQGLLQRRWNTTGSTPPQKEVSPHVCFTGVLIILFLKSEPISLELELTIMLELQIGFYKTFTRPIAKVLLMATFTYQLVYWGWVKLETDEVKGLKNGQLFPLLVFDIWGK